MAQKTEFGPIEIIGKSIVKLHKSLKKEDLLEAEAQIAKGKPATTAPEIAIDFAGVTSIQQDFRKGDRCNTIITDNKATVCVLEPFHEVLDVWMQVQEACFGN